MAGTRIDELAALFDDTLAAHHAAFEELEGIDPEWPLWYAEYMQARLNEILDEELTVSEIVYRLVGLSLRQPEEAPDEPWQQFYARNF